MCPYGLHTSVGYLVYRYLHTDSTNQSNIWSKNVTILTPQVISDKWCTDIFIQSPHINMTSGVHMCSWRLHTSVWYLVYRCVHRDSTHQCDNLCTDISIQTPHISLISCLQMSLYRLHTWVWYLVYRCHYTDSTHQSDHLCTDVSIQTPHMSLTTGVQMSSYILQT
jgi:hypothetical protein